MENIVSITCDPNYDPPLIFITVGPPATYTYSIPKPIYDAAREPLGLPDVVCGDPD